MTTTTRTITIPFKRGTTAQNDAYTGNPGEITIDSTLRTIRVHDGIKVGGERLLRLSDLTDDVLPAIETAKTYRDRAILAESNAHASELAAASSASHALTSEGNAAASEAIAVDRAAFIQGKAELAGDKADIATQQAAIATQKATDATTQAGISTQKAAEASTSAAAALASQNTATTQAGIATQKAADAAASAAAALASQNTATTQAGIATDKANIILGKIDTATNEADRAYNEANRSRDEADRSNTRANDSSASAAAALASQNAAKGSEDVASAKAAQLSAQLYAFNEMYIGQRANNPVVDGNGNPLKEGAIYQNTTDDKLYSYENGVWTPYDAESQQQLNNAMLSAQNAAGSEANALTYRNAAQAARDTAIDRATFSDQRAIFSDQRATFSDQRATFADQRASFADQRANDAKASADLAAATVAGKADLAGAIFTGAVETTQQEVLRVRDNTNAVRGHLWYDNNGWGLLNEAGNWAFRVNRDGTLYLAASTTLEGSLTVTKAATITTGLTSLADTYVGRANAVNGGRLEVLAGAAQNAVVSQVQNNAYSMYQGFNSTGGLAFQAVGQGDLLIDGGAGKGRLSFSSSLASQNALYSTTTGFGSYAPMTYLASRHIFSVGSGGSQSEGMRLDELGRLGLGTAAPSFKLHVSGTSYFEAPYNTGATVAVASFVRAGGAVQAAVRYNDAKTMMEMGTVTGHDYAIITNGVQRARFFYNGGAAIRNAADNRNVVLVGEDNLRISSSQSLSLSNILNLESPNTNVFVNLDTYSMGAYNALTRPHDDVLFSSDTDTQSGFVVGKHNGASIRFGARSAPLAFYANGKSMEYNGARFRVQGPTISTTQGSFYTLAYQVDINGSETSVNKNLIGHWWDGTFDCTSIQVPGDLGNNAFIDLKSHGGLGIADYAKYNERLVIKGMATNRWIYRDIGTVGNPNEGTYMGYLILAKAFNGGNTPVDQSFVLGTITMKRGHVSSGQRTDILRVMSKSGYLSEHFHVDAHTYDGYLTRLVKVTYQGVVYHAIETTVGGGGIALGGSFAGELSNADIVYVESTQVSNVVPFGQLTHTDISTNYLGLGKFGPGARLHINDTNTYGNAKKDLIRLHTISSTGDTTQPTSLGQINWWEPTYGSYATINAVQESPYASTAATLRLGVNGGEQVTISGSWTRFGNTVVVAGWSSSNIVADLNIYRTGTPSAVVGKGANIQMDNMTGNSHVMLQEYDSGLIMFQAHPSIVSGGWRQTATWDRYGNYSTSQLVVAAAGQELGWRPLLSNFSYDNQAHFYWMRVGQIPGDGCLIIDAICKGDFNYPYALSARIIAASYGGVSYSLSVQRLAGDDDNMIRACIDSGGGLWIYMAAMWNRTVSMQVVSNANCTVYATADVVSQEAQPTNSIVVWCGTSARIDKATMAITEKRTMPVFGYQGTLTVSGLVTAQDAEFRSFASARGVDMRIGAESFIPNVAAIGSLSSHRLAFFTAGAEAMTLSTSGWLAIGTNSPACKFHIEGTTSTAKTDSVMLLRGANINSDQFRLMFNHNASGFASIGTPGGGGLSFGRAADSSGTISQEWGRFTNSGTFLIASTIEAGNPGSIGLRAGTVGQLIAIADSGGFYQQVQGNYYTVNTNAGYTSDRSLKKNIVEVENVLDKVCNISTYHFEYIEPGLDTTEQGVQLGVMADEIEAQFPEIVNIRPDGKRTVRYDRLAVPLYSALKELRQQFEDYKALHQ